ncbi:MAG: T9SS type A sorting domain-containing protein [Bacteroidales bacterium]|jgi:hypothetical protein|nr:T9SS type A sorting domain-containing protein [Bacteroidales bacterium]
MKFGKTHTEGDQYDSFNSSLLLSNGNIIMTGTSQSGISGIKTEANRGSFDVWLVCINSDGEVIWDKTLGGEEFDLGVRLMSSDSDNVFLLSNSSSGIGYEKTEACIGGNDIWLTEINPENGSVIWDKTIGSNNTDNPVDFLLTGDNFYILSSSLGDISGDKTEDCRGGDDYWLVKVDLFGNVIIDKTIGGNNVDLAACIYYTDTTGIIIGGSSKSDAGFEKSEDAYDPSNFNEDYWVVSLNVDFEIVWDKTIGGDSRDLLRGCLPISSTNLMLYGSSSSDISFDRNVPLVGVSDIWVAEMQIPPFTSFIIHQFVENKLECYPNPTCNFLYVKNQGVSYVSLVDFSGKIVFETENDFQHLNLEELPSGVYFMNAIIDDKSFTSKIVKQ